MATRLAFMPAATSLYATHHEKRIEKGTGRMKIT
jgi:hypothetical protein